ncbi:GNAT family N-acetyltransferase [Thioclava sp. SK-1]|uniref:GNAT family N-acetyltransferase n=1 Tax=Thioclava sp. SK-1 TaxID=1889770 RepID=UPI000A4F255D|nr:GNAT family N-acetyltransferase [Thioclava sp. SK-1]
MEQITILESALSGDDWDLALAALDSAVLPALQQSGPYGDIAAMGGRRVLRLILSRGGERIAMAQLIGRAGLWWLGRGPVCRQGVTLDHRLVLRKIARHLRGVLIATPETLISGRGLIPLVTPRHHAIWALGPAGKTLREGMAGKWRNRLAAAERKGIGIALEDDPKWLLQAETAQRKLRGYKSLPAEFVQAWEFVRPGGVLTLSAKNDRGDALAGVVFLYHGNGASYQVGWSGEEGRAVGAHNLLLWQVALALKAQGLRWLDLGDINSEEGEGLMRFKLGTGAQAQQLGATVLVLPG